MLFSIKGDQNHFLKRIRHLTYGPYDRTSHIKYKIACWISTLERPCIIHFYFQGGLLAIRVSIEYSDLVDGMLLESPMLNLNDGISGLWGKRAASSFLSYLVPNLKFNLGMNLNIIFI